MQIFYICTEQIMLTETASHELKFECATAVHKKRRRYAFLHKPLSVCAKVHTANIPPQRASITGVHRHIRVTATARWLKKDDSPQFTSPLKYETVTHYIIHVF